MSLATAWLATYALHGTLLMALALLIEGRLRAHSPPLAERVLRLALCGALLTATLQVGYGKSPLGRSLDLPAAAGVFRAPAAPLVPAPGAVLPAPAPAAVSAAALDFGWTGRDFGRFLVLLWALSAALLLFRYALTWHLLNRQLRERRRLAGGPLVDTLQALCRQEGCRPPQVSVSPRLAVPIARGLLRPEIVLPERVLTELPREQQRSVLAHELCHVLRRDPAWLLFLGLVECVLFFQPLNRVLRLRLQEISEYLCDDFCVQRTGQPQALLHCLTEVASWVLGDRDALPVPGMAGTSMLSRRVHRLLDQAQGGARAVPRWLLPAGVAVLLVVAACAPGVSAARPAAAAPPPRLVHEHQQCDGDPDRDAEGPPGAPAAPVPPARMRMRMRIERQIGLHQDLAQAHAEMDQHRAEMEQALLSQEHIRELARQTAQEAREHAREMAARAREQAQRAASAVAEAHAYAHRGHWPLGPEELKELEQLKDLKVLHELKGLKQQQERLQQERQRLEQDRQHLQEERRLLEEERRKLREQSNKTDTST